MKRFGSLVLFPNNCMVYFKNPCNMSYEEHIEFYVLITEFMFGDMKPVVLRFCNGIWPNR